MKHEKLYTLFHTHNERWLNPSSAHILSFLAHSKRGLTSRGSANPFIRVPAAGYPKHSLIKKEDVGNQQLGF